MRIVFCVTLLFLSSSWCCDGVDLNLRHIMVNESVKKDIKDLSDPKRWINCIVTRGQPLIEHILFGEEVGGEKGKKYGHVATVSNVGGVDNDKMIILQSEDTLPRDRDFILRAAVAFANLFFKVMSHNSGCNVNLKQINATRLKNITVKVNGEAILISKFAGYRLHDNSYKHIQGFIISVSQEGDKITSVAPILCD